MLPLVLALSAPRFQALQVDYVSSTAKMVQFAGDLTGWDHPKLMDHQGDHWTISFRLPPNARVEYKLIVDGKNWILDPNDPLKVDNGLGGENSVFQGRLYRMIPEDRTPKHPMHRKVIHVGGRSITIFTPDSPAGKPLLVYADGPSYEMYGHIQNFVENLIESGRIKPVVVALVPPIDREKEYGRGWKAYGQYLLGSVLPAVRKASGASAKASDLYLGGSSLGGVIALRLAEEYPTKVAGGIQSQSGAFQWTPLNLDNTEIITPQALKKLAPTTKIWLDFGVFEDKLSTSNQTAMKNLDDLKRKFEWKVTPEGHNWTAWRHRMASGLMYILRPDQPLSH